MLGRIAEGFTADAVLFNADPYKVQDATVLRKSIRSVITAMGAGPEPGGGRPGGPYSVCRNRSLRRPS
jgi:hypothetical protein